MSWNPSTSDYHNKELKQNYSQRTIVKSFILYILPCQGFSTCLRYCTAVNTWKGGSARLRLRLGGSKRQLWPLRRQPVELFWLFGEADRFLLPGGRAVLLSSSNSGDSADLICGKYYRSGLVYRDSDVRIGRNIVNIPQEKCSEI